MMFWLWFVSAICYFKILLDNEKRMKSFDREYQTSWPIFAFYMFFGLIPIVNTIFVLFTGMVLIGISLSVPKEE